MRMVSAARADVDRIPATLARTVGAWIDLSSAPSRGWNALTGTPEEIAAGLRNDAGVGYSQVQVWLNPGTLEGVEGFAPVLKRLGQAQ